MGGKFLCRGPQRIFELRRRPLSIHRIHEIGRAHVYGLCTRVAPAPLRSITPGTYGRQISLPGASANFRTPAPPSLHPPDTRDRKSTRLRSVSQGSTSSLAIDHSGNVWAANFFAGGLSEFSNSGAALSPSTGYTGGGLVGVDGLAIDGAGNIWLSDLTNHSAEDVTEFSNSGSPI